MARSTGQGVTAHRRRRQADAGWHCMLSSLQAFLLIASTACGTSGTASQIYSHWCAGASTLEFCTMEYDHSHEGAPSAAIFP